MLRKNLNLEKVINFQRAKVSAVITLAKRNAEGMGFRH